MTPIRDEAGLQAARAEPAALLLYGGPACGVCRALEPQLEALLRDEFPAMKSFHIDCQGEAAGLCARQGIFSLPVVQLWFSGRRFEEFVRVFPLGRVRTAIARPYSLIFG